MSGAVLELGGLTVAYGDPGAVVVEGVSLELHAGQVLALVGESGCGKSTTALAMLGYRGAGRVTAGTSVLDGRDLLAMEVAELRRVWGREISYVPQGARSALSPSLRIGRQLREPLMLHGSLDRAAATDRAGALLESVELPGTNGFLRRYPHELSGGQQQRVAFALAVACRPAVLVLDEPTTGLDPTTQVSATRVLQELVDDTGTGALYVTHDLGLVRDLAASVAVMYAGRVVEQGPAAQVLGDPAHPYTAALVAAVPTLKRRALPRSIPGMPPPAAVRGACAFAPRCAHRIAGCDAGDVPLVGTAPARSVRCIRGSERFERTPAPEPARAAPRLGARLLDVERLSCGYRDGRSYRDAVRDVSIDVDEGEVLAIVGESGSGKSTLLRAIAGLLSPRSGRVVFGGTELDGAIANRPKRLTRELQIVFQNPDLALNPRKTVRQEIARPVVLFQSAIGVEGVSAEVERLVGLVRLSPDVLERRADELSGGQRQRVALARAFAARPTLLLCDEVTSALDVSVQAAILNTLVALARDTGTALVFVSHDFGVVRSIADRVVVLRAGAVCESADAEVLFERPRHDYTRELLAATSTLE